MSDARLDAIHDHERRFVLSTILDAVWQAHQEGHALRMQHVDQLDDDPQRTLYAREDSLIMETVHVTLKGVARRAGVAWHGAYDKDAA